MDETMTNEVEVEVSDADAILPEGWTEDIDIFSDEFLAEEPETSGTPATEPSNDFTTEVDPATVEQDPVSEEPTTEETPATESAETPPSTSHKYKFTTKVDHNDLDVELDEADIPELYQKAHVVDRVRAQMTEMQGTVDRASKLAKGMGFENADAMLIAAAKNHLQNEIDKLVNDEEHPVHPAVARDIMERRLGYTMEELENVNLSPAPAATPAPETTAPAPAPTQAPVQGRDFSSEVQELVTAHPERRGKELPDEVVQDAITSGKRLLQAYQDYERNSQAKQVQDLVKENRVLKQNAETAQRAPVTGVTGHGIEGNQPDDPFEVGFDEGARW